MISALGRWVLDGVGTAGYATRMFLRLVAGTTLVEATLQGERLLLHGSAPVLDAIAAGSLMSGGRILICPRRHLALGVVPPETDYGHRFLDRGRVPDVIAQRDIGKPQLAELEIGDVFP